ncbi:hypothetical protein IGI39_004849 [Enterococcus sp. AZ135]
MFVELSNLATFIGFIILFKNRRDFYPKLNTILKIGFILLCLGTLFPIFYRFVNIFI